MSSLTAEHDDENDTSFKDLDTSIREQVQQAISRVAAVDWSEQSEEEDLLSPLTKTPHTLPLSPDALEQQRRECEEQVRRLEAEVGLLEDEIGRRDRPLEGATDEELERAVLSLVRTEGESSDRGGGSSTASEEEDSDRIVRLLRSQIKLNQAFSGIKFKSAQWEIIHKDTDSSVVHRKHVHTGSTYGFDFLTEFVVQEEKSESCGSLDPPDKARIVALRAQVDPRVQVHLQPFLIRICRDCNLMKFYQTYVKFCLLVHERREAFATAKSLFHRNVHFTEDANGNRLHFAIHNGPNLYFTWNVTVSERGYVDHALSMQVKTPPNLPDDDRASVSQLPQLLQKMVVVHGHHEALLKLLSLFQQPH